MPDTGVSILDFTRHHKLIMTFAGIHQFQSGRIAKTINAVYNVAAPLVMFLFLTSCVVCTILLPKEYSVLRFEAMYYGLLMLFSFSCFVNGVAYSDSVQNGIKYLSAGLYAYPNDFLQRQCEMLTAKRIKEVKTISMSFIVLLIGGGISYLVPVPLVLSTPRPVPHFLHPYLPIPFYFPFNVNSPIGFGFSFLLCALSMFFVVFVAAGNLQSFFGILCQLRAQFELLNYSVMNLERRALDKLEMKNSATNDELRRQPIFQDAICLCLAENVKHHQDIIKFADLMYPYIGSFFTIFRIQIVLIFGFGCYFVTEMNGTPLDFFRSGVNLVCVYSLVLQLCRYGQEITDENEKLFDVTYDTLWYTYDVRPRRMINFMLLRTKKPYYLRTNCFDMAASLESFTSIMTVAYQLVNLMRSTK